MHFREFLGYFGKQQKYIKKSRAQGKTKTRTEKWRINKTHGAGENLIKPNWLLPLQEWEWKKKCLITVIISELTSFDLIGLPSGSMTFGSAHSDCAYVSLCMKTSCTAANTQICHVSCRQTWMVFRFFDQIRYKRDLWFSNIILSFHLRSRSLSVRRSFLTTIHSNASFNFQCWIEHFTYINIIIFACTIECFSHA